MMDRNGKEMDMKKICLVLILLVMTSLWIGCAKEATVSVKDETSVKKTSASKPRIATPTTAGIPDSKVWAYLGKTKSGETYYKRKVTTQSSHLISVTTYKIVSDDYRTKTIEEVKKYDVDKSVKYQNYEHEVRVDEIDCKNMWFRVKEIARYDDRGNALDSYSYENEKWKTIPILTGLDQLREKFCVSQKKASKKK